MSSLLRLPTDPAAPPAPLRLVRVPTAGFRTAARARREAQAGAYSSSESYSSDQGGWPYERAEESRDIASEIAELKAQIEAIEARRGDERLDWSADGDVSLTSGGPAADPRLSEPRRSSGPAGPRVEVPFSEPPGRLQLSAGRRDAWACEPAFELRGDGGRSFVQVVELTAADMAAFDDRASARARLRGEEGPGPSNGSHHPLHPSRQLLSGTRSQREAAAAAAEEAEAAEAEAEAEAEAWLSGRYLSAVDVALGGRRRQFAAETGGGAAGGGGVAGGSGGATARVSARLHGMQQQMSALEAAADELESELGIRAARRGAAAASAPTGDLLSPSVGIAELRCGAVEALDTARQLESGGAALDGLSAPRCGTPIPAPQRAFEKKSAVFQRRETTAFVRDTGLHCPILCSQLLSPQALLLPPPHSARVARGRRRPQPPRRKASAAATARRPLARQLPRGGETHTHTDTDTHTHARTHTPGLALSMPCGLLSWHLAPCPTGAWVERIASPRLT